MKLMTRLLVAVPFLGMAAYCLFGFWASFEGGKLNVFHLMYGSIGVACIALAEWARRTQAPTLPLRLILGLLSSTCFGFLVWLGGAFMDWWPLSLP